MLSNPSILIMFMFLLFNQQSMKPKYILYSLFAFAAIIGWNAFLIQRDDALYKSYYKQQAIQQMK
jgi:hypothetical protein